MTSNNWWADKLGTPRQPQAMPPTQMPQQPVYQPQQPTYQPQPPVQQGAPRLPQSAVNAQWCPGCGSGNYGSSPLAPESRARCYDCGYPITQSGSGAAGVNQGQASGPTQAAKQVPTGGWNPTTIIGKIE